MLGQDRGSYEVDFVREFGAVLSSTVHPASLDASHPHSLSHGLVEKEVASLLCSALEELQRNCLDETEPQRPDNRRSRPRPILGAQETPRWSERDLVFAREAL